MIRIGVQDLLAGAAALSPDAPALTYRRETMSYEGAWSGAQAVAGRLLSLGLERGDRVAVYLEKRIETVLAIFGAATAGAMFVPVNPVLKPSQVRHILTDSGARFLVTSAERLGQLAGILPAAAIEHVIVVGPAPSPAPGVDVHAWPRATDAASSALRHVPVDSDPAAILYTSGSTGRPKGVVLSHRNVIAGAESVSSYLGNSADDVILSVLPLSFDAGFSQVTTSFAVGAHCVLMNYLLPREVPGLCAQHGVTGLTGVPPLWLQLVDASWPVEAARRIRYFANTGGRMPRATLDRLRGVFVDADPYLMYGLTEAFRSTYLDPAEVDRRPHSIGKAIPNAEILVLRPDGTRCAPGEEGELVHRGPLVAMGYWGNPVRTAERFRPIGRAEQPWRAPEIAVWSGDTVIADDEGFLYFVGRTDDMIKTSGYRVSPTEIEEAAYSTSIVRDAVAVGVADPALGQRIILVVTSPNGALDSATVMSALRPLLPLYMLPARVEVRDELPRSANGKFDRAVIRAEVSA